MGGTIYVDCFPGEGSWVGDQLGDAFEAKANHCCGERR
jgi:hypothetical protein